MPRGQPFWVILWWANALLWSRKDLYEASHELTAHGSSFRLQLFHRKALWSCNTCSLTASRSLGLHICRTSRNITLAVGAFARTRLPTESLRAPCSSIVMLGYIRAHCPCPRLCSSFVCSGMAAGKILSYSASVRRSPTTTPGTTMTSTALPSTTSMVRTTVDVVSWWILGRSDFPLLLVTL